MKISERIAVGAVVILVILLIGGCIRWRWGECRKVGHGVAYCIMEQGR